MTEPTYVLVHGAWHGAWSWRLLTEEFDRRSVAWRTLELPSSHDDGDGTSDLGSDVQAVVSAVDFDGPTVLVGHSYAGAVIAEASGQLDKLVGLVFIAALIPTIGQSATDVSRLGGVRTELDAAMTVDGPRLRLDPSLARSALYGDCQESVATDAVSRLGSQTIASFRSKREYPDAAARRHYIRCTNDRAIDPTLQLLMASSCDTTIEIASDHSPFLSHPEICADAVATW